MKAVDMHCDTVSALYEKRKKGSGETLLCNGGHVDVEKLRRGGVLVQNFALFVDRGKTKAPFEEARRMAAFYYDELKRCSQWMAPALTFQEMEKNGREGKISALLTVEEGAACAGSVTGLHQLYEWGVRMMTLTWNYPNEIGYPNLNLDQMGHRTGRTSGDSEGSRGPSGSGGDSAGCKRLPFYKIADCEHGLTEKGKELVEEMERIGMIIDVSHLSDAGFYDVLAHTRKPFVASHSNARAVCPWVRNLTDDMLRRLSERGGVVGLNFCPDFLAEAGEGESNPGTIDAVVEHARHMAKAGGTDCIGLGSDFDGIDGHAQLKDCSYLPRLADALRRAGFTESEVEKIFHKNVLRVYREIL